jgi:hypothetical protein
MFARLRAGLPVPVAFKVITATVCVPVTGVVEPALNWIEPADTLGAGNVPNAEPGVMLT